MPDRAADRRAEQGVMTGEMAGDAAERRTGQASGLRPGGGTWSNAEGGNDPNVFHNLLLDIV